MKIAIRVVSLILLQAAAAFAAACAGIGTEPVLFNDQTNVIIWNPQTHTEHFIRVASFKSTGKDFAFIAPTPEKPELELADLAFSQS